MKLTGALMMAVIGIGLAGTIEIGNSEYGVNEPWCGS